MTHLATTGASNKPNTKVTRQEVSPAFGGNKPSTMPVMPKIRPLLNSSNAAAKPSNSPPANEGQGVK